MVILETLGAMALLTVIFAVMIARSFRYSFRAIETATVSRPGETVVASHGSIDARRDARRAGVRRKELGPGRLFAVVVRSEVFEIWAGHDEQPRWTVSRDRADISVVRVAVEYYRHGESMWHLIHYRRGVLVTDGVTRVHIVPVDGSYWTDDPVEGTLFQLRKVPRAHIRRIPEHGESASGSETPSP